MKLIAMNVKYPLDYVVNMQLKYTSSDLITQKIASRHRYIIQTRKLF